jgi:penicillin-binding protein 1A
MDLDYQLYIQEALRRGLENLTHRQGYQGPIKSILPRDNGQLPRLEIASSIGDDFLTIGSIVRGVVTKIDLEKEVSHIQLRGEHHGLLEWEHLKKWQRIWQLEKQNYGWVRSMSDILTVGDVIEVQLKDYVSSENVFRLKLHQAPKVNGGIITLNPSNGYVYAMSGGYDYTASEFNRSTQAVRQPGSAFKPIVYAAALDSGYTLNSRLVDSPRAYKTDNRIFGQQEVWMPKNYGDKLMGSVTLRSALVKSLNLPTVGLVEDLGPQRLINYSRQLGISTNMDKNLTIGLGSFSVTLKEMVEAYSVFANHGQRIEPVFITKIEDTYGNILEENKNIAKNVISEETAFLITDAMRDVVNRGTGVKAKAIGRPSAGKTGTTNDSKDAWYIGFIPQLLTGVFVGYDNPKSMGNTETGSRAAAPIWVDFMKKAVANLATEQFSQPPGVITVKVHESGRRAAPCDPPEQTFYEHYRVGTEPATDNLIHNLCASQQRLAASDSENKLEL